MRKKGGFPAKFFPIIHEAIHIGENLPKSVPKRPEKGAFRERGAAMVVSFLPS